MTTVESLVVNRNQPRAFQAGGGAGLALEAGQELLIAGVPRIHDLECHQAVEPGVQAAVHRGHAAAGDGCVHAVAPVQHRTDQWVRLSGWLHLAIVRL